MPPAERDLEHLLRRSTAGVGLEVAAAEPHAVQLVWAALPEGRHTLQLAGRRLEIDGDGGPGSIVVDELAPDTDVHVELRGPRGEELVTREVRTGRAPAGDELFRFATISDLHLGRDRFHAPRNALGVTVPRPPHEGGDLGGDGAREPAGRSTTTDQLDPSEDRATACARAALDEAIAWGAQLVVVKGDVCEESYDATWDLAAWLLGDLPVPVVIIPGNHDTGTLRHFEPEVGAAQRGLDVIRGVGHRDVPGLRIIAVDSTVPGSGWGDVARHADEAAALAADADGAVFIATHHQPQRFTTPLYWPHGIPGPNARRFARAVRAAAPHVLASSGHTHRNRRRRVAGMPWTEVASTSHFPGVWAGYSVHEGGLHQTVRRIAEPDALAWSQESRRMLHGVWALWAAGELDDRCFTLDW